MDHNQSGSELPENLTLSMEHDTNDMEYSHWPAWMSVKVCHIYALFLDASHLQIESLVRPWLPDNR